MTTWPDLQDKFNALIFELTESGRLAKRKDQSEDSKATTSQAGRSATGSNNTVGGVPVRALLLPGKRRKAE
jgi:hypothetical protein